LPCQGIQALIFNLKDANIYKQIMLMSSSLVRLGKLYLALNTHTHMYFVLCVCMQFNFLLLQMDQGIKILLRLINIF